MKGQVFFILLQGEGRTVISICLLVSIWKIVARLLYMKKLVTQ